jgi:PAS domain S-box-containing protein
MSKKLLKKSYYSNHSEIRNKNELILSTLDGLKEGIIITNEKGKFIYFNAVATRILGIGLKDTTPDQWTSVYGCYHLDGIKPYPPEKLPLALAINGESITNERIFIKNSEKKEGVYISVDAYPVKNARGAIIGASVTFRDISETFRSEKALDESRIQQKAQFRGYPQPTYVWQNIGDDFILSDYNQAAEKFNNGSISKHIGSKLSVMYAESPDIVADFWTCFEDKSVLCRELTYTFRNETSVRNWILNYVYLPPNSVVVHTEEVTQKKQNDLQLRKLSSAMEQTADSVILTDKHGIIEYVNQAFEKTTGYTAKEAIGKTPAILKSGHHDSAFYSSLWNTILAGNPYIGTIMNKKKDGELYWCEQSITPMKDESGNISDFVSVIKDISELKMKQEQDFYLRIAREVQQHLSGIKISAPGFDIAGMTHSALETSGDYFDFIHTADDHILLAVGDVCGHGVGAALIMAETRAYLRAFARIQSDPEKILKMLNDELSKDLDEYHYVTLILVRIDIFRKLLVYSSAGHIPAYIVRCNGEVSNILKSTGMPLGFLTSAEYSVSEEISLNSGDILALITDGITEAVTKDEDEFGHERMIDILNSHKKESAQEIAKSLNREVCLFAGQEQLVDDITSVICKVD